VEKRGGGNMGKRFRLENMRVSDDERGMLNLN
jgi:hypothetical protein